MTCAEAWMQVSEGKAPHGLAWELFVKGWNAAMDEARREAGLWGKGRQGMQASDAIARAIEKKKLKLPGPAPAEE